MQSLFVEFKCIYVSPRITFLPWLSKARQISDDGYLSSCMIVASYKVDSWE